MGFHLGSLLVDTWDQAQPQTPPSGFIAEAHPYGATFPDEMFFLPLCFCVEKYHGSAGWEVVPQLSFLFAHNEAQR